MLFFGNRSNTGHVSAADPTKPSSRLSSGYQRAGDTPGGPPISKPQADATTLTAKCMKAGTTPEHFTLSHAPGDTAGAVAVLDALNTMSAEDIEACRKIGVDPRAFAATRLLERAARIAP